MMHRFLHACHPQSISNIGPQLRRQLKTANTLGYPWTPTSRNRLQKEYISFLGVSIGNADDPLQSRMHWLPIAISDQDDNPARMRLQQAYLETWKANLSMHVLGYLKQGIGDTSYK